MSDINKTTTNGEDVMDDIGKLVRFAGERETVSAERLANARARVGAHWQDVVTSKRRQKVQNRWRQFSIAASLVAAVGITIALWQMRSAPTTEQLVAVDRVAGEVMIDGRAAQNGIVFATNSVIQTGTDGLVAMQFPSGQSVRLDHETRLVVSASDRVELIAGGVYVDSGPAPHSATIAVETRFGVATDVGTQFQVRIDDDQLQIGVREGLVELARPNTASLEIDAGNLYEVWESGEETGRRITGNDPIWSFAALIVPSFDIELATLEEYLRWYAREAGVALVWETDESYDIARRTELRGSINGMTLKQGFNHVRRLAPFESRVTESTLYILVE